MSKNPFSAYLSGREDVAPTFEQGSQGSRSVLGTLREAIRDLLWRRTQEADLAAECEALALQIHERDKREARAAFKRIEAARQVTVSKLTQPLTDEEQARLNLVFGPKRDSARKWMLEMHAKEKEHVNELKALGLRTSGCSTRQVPVDDAEKER